MQVVDECLHKCMQYPETKTNLSSFQIKFNQQAVTHRTVRSTTTTTIEVLLQRQLPSMQTHTAQHCSFGNGKRCKFVVNAWYPMQILFVSTLEARSWPETGWIVCALMDIILATIQSYSMKWKTEILNREKIRLFEVSSYVYIV